ncbi:MAG: MbnP family protein [Flavobacteriales bacterium]
MKSILTLVTTISLVSSITLFGQNSIEVKLHHHLDGKNFKLGRIASTNMDQSFSASRLEYYLSEFAIKHDGGMITTFDSSWVLVETTETTSIDLGSAAITNVESILFHVGVDSAANHADPTEWPFSHPLSPKSPSMHWGWAAGYRFVAFEGDYEPAVEFQFHCLGDINYFEIEIDVQDTASNGEIRIDLFADYTEALHDIDISAGVIEHSETGPAKQCLENFRDYVFSGTEIEITDPTDTSGSSGVSAVALDRFIQVAPNPVNNGLINVHFNEAIPIDQCTIELYDLTGKQMRQLNIQRNSSFISIPGVSSGVYFLKVVDRGSDLSTIKKVSVL